MITRKQAIDFLLEFSGKKDCPTKDCIIAYRRMKNICRHHPKLVPYLFETLKESMAFSGFNSESYPQAYELFCNLVALTPIETSEGMCNEIFKLNPDFAISDIQSLLYARPELSTKAFDMIYYKNQDNNEVLNTILQASDDKAALLLNLALNNKNTQTHIYDNLWHIYDCHPDMGEKLLDLIVEYRHLHETYFYTNAAHIAASNPIGMEDNFVGVVDEPVFNPLLRERAVQLIEKSLDNPDHTALSLSSVYKACGCIMRYIPQYSDRITAVINKALQNPANNSSSRRIGHNELSRFEKYASSVFLYQRVSESEDADYAMKRIDNIDNNTPCIFVLGGDGTKSDQNINGYMGDFYRLLQEYGLEHQANVYGIVYDFGDYYQPKAARIKLMDDYHRNLSTKHVQVSAEHQAKIFERITPESKNPKYIKDLFNILILPRIADGNGHKLEDNQAKRNIRNLQIFAHCHGAYTALKLEEMMQKKMQELGYTSKARADIQKQLLVISQSPDCPVGVSKSTTLSFFSASDTRINHDNHFQNAIEQLRKKGKIPLSYFSGQRGNVFFTNSIGKIYDEHNFWGMLLTNMVSEDGNNLIMFERKALINGVKSAISGTDLPDISNLIADDAKSRDLLNKAIRNGNLLYEKIYNLALSAAKNNRNNAKSEHEGRSFYEKLRNLTANIKNLGR